MIALTEREVGLVRSAVALIEAARTGGDVHVADWLDAILAGTGTPAPASVSELMALGALLDSAGALTVALARDVVPDTETRSRARLAIRPTKFRGEVGYLVCGRDTKHRRVSIFTATMGSAEHIRQRVKAGQEITYSDFEPRVVDR